MDKDPFLRVRSQAVEHERASGLLDVGNDGDMRPRLEHLIPRSPEADANPAPIIERIETVAPVTKPQAVPPVPMQKELLVNTSVDDAPKTPAVTDCVDPLVPIQKYKAYYRAELQRYNAGQRPLPSTPFATIEYTPSALKIRHAEAQARRVQRSARTTPVLESHLRLIPQYRCTTHSHRR